MLDNDLIGAWFDEDLEVEFYETPGWMTVFGAEGGRRRGLRQGARRALTEWLQLGEHMQVRARKGFRATSVQLGDGQYLVTVIPEQDAAELNKDKLAFGVVNAAAQSLESIVRMIIQAAQRRKQRGEAAPADAPDTMQDAAPVSGWGAW